MSEEIINKMVNDNADSLEIGTPAKGGAIKCYLNFDRVEEFKKKIDNAFEVRRYAQKLMESQTF